MSKIQILPESLINKIAAGEVVERPASVVKELVENSIDAGSNQIFVTIKNGGKDLISVLDNGSGMTADDAQLSIERHATSKIITSDDLENINTMG
ncbi:ATP-binding protein, partial [bacterium]|nr:ATP-binding protein [bacterium]